MRTQTDNPSILIADDSQNGLQLLTTILADHNYTTYDVEDGANVLASVSEVGPDLVLLTVDRSEMSGYQVCQALKADERLQATPVILTVSDASVDRSKCFQSGADDVLVQPFQSAEVLVRVHMQLELRRQRFELAMRNRELDCLHQLSALVADPDVALDMLLQETLRLIPGSQPEPDVVSARITLDGQEYATEHFRVTDCQLADDIQINGEIIGRVEVFHCDDSPGRSVAAITEHQQAFISQVARQIGTKVQERRTGEVLEEALNEVERQVQERVETTSEASAQLQAESVERQQAEEKLWESEQRYRALFDRANDAIFILDLEGNHLVANQQAADMLGYEIGEMNGLTFKDIVVPQLHDDSWDRRNALVAGEILPVYERVFRKKNGTEVPVEINVSLTHDRDGNPLHIQSIVRDITARKQAEEALQESEERHRLLFETMVQGVVYQNRDGAIVAANPAAEQILGLSLDEMMGRVSADPRWRAIKEDGSDFLGEEHPSMMALKTGKEIRNVVMGVFNPQQEEYRWININAVPQFRPGESEAYQVYATFNDITERRQFEEALRENEKSLELALEGANLGIWSHDFATGKTSVDQRWAGMLGYTPDEISNVPTFWEEEVHPDDKALVHERVMDHFEQRTPQYSVESRIRTKDGDWRWISAHGKVVVRDKDGKPLRFTGTHQDITERKVAEQRYRTLFDNAPMMHIVTRNQDGMPIITDVNLRFLAKVGYSRADVIGRPLIDFYTPESTRHLLHGGGYQRALDGMFEDEERQLVTREGRIIDTLLRAVREESADGSVIGTSAMFIDVTRRKKVEGALQESARRLRLITENMRDTVFAYDMDRELWYANPAFETLTGYPLEELYERDFIDFIHPEDKGKVSMLWEGLFHGNAFTNVEYRLMTKDGQVRWCSSSGSPLYEEGQQIGVQGREMDITEYRQAELALRQYTNDQAALYEASRIFLDQIEVDSVLDKACQLAVQHYDLKMAWVGLVDKDNPKTLHPMSSYTGTKGDPAVDVVPVTWDDNLSDHNPMSLVIRTAQAIGVNQIETSPTFASWRETVLQQGYRSSASLPLCHGKNVLGVLNVYSAESEHFSADRLQALQSFTNQVAAALQKAQLYEQVQDHAAQLERRVSERTAELATANVQLREEVVERKRAEEAEHEQRNLAEALRDTSLALSSTLNFDAILDRILANVGRVVPHDLADVMLIEEDIARLVRIAPTTTEYEAHYGRQSIAATPRLRRMVETREVLRITDTLKSEVWTDEPDDTVIRSYLGAPILLEEHVIGFINLFSDMPGFFETHDADRLRIFANQASIAVQNSRRYQQAQELAAFQERQRLARDLHDAVTQTIFSASIIAESLQRLWDTKPDMVRQHLGTIHRLVRGGLAEMRVLLLELRPHAMLEADLHTLLNHLSEALMGQTEIRCDIIIEGETTLLVDEKVAFYRIAQEAMNNVKKHSRATEAFVKLRCTSGTTELTIQDNGIGFAPERVTGDHLGLKIMRERADEIGAEVNIGSQLGDGTKIVVTWSES